MNQLQVMDIQRKNPLAFDVGLRFNAAYEVLPEQLGRFRGRRDHRGDAVVHDTSGGSEARASLGGS
jgi:hypothetical protein